MDDSVNDAASQTEQEKGFQYLRCATVMISPLRLRSNVIQAFSYVLCSAVS